MYTTSAMGRDPVWSGNALVTLTFNDDSAGTHDVEAAVQDCADSTSSDNVKRAADAIDGRLDSGKNAPASGEIGNRNRSEAYS
jgi:hypothetical protein